MTNSTASTSAITFSFAVLNRTVWTAKKQSLSGNAGGNRQEEDLDTGNCILCGMPEETAHILVNCNNYSYRAWERASTIITLACRAIEPENGIINLTFSNIISHRHTVPSPDIQETDSFLSTRIQKRHKCSTYRKMHKQRRGKVGR
jgi:hypothetical protein